MSATASQINNLTIVYSTVCSGPDQRKHPSTASLVFVRGISPHKGPVTRKMFPFDDVIMKCLSPSSCQLSAPLQMSSAAVVTPRMSRSALTARENTFPTRQENAKVEWVDIITIAVHYTLNHVLNERICDRILGTSTFEVFLIQMWSVVQKALRNLSFLTCGNSYP